MPISESDPRVFFAAERTLLAWLRTGLTIITLGFVISRFGLFIQLLAIQTQPHTGTHSHISGWLGIGFVVIGTLAIVVATIQHMRFISTLSLVDLPPHYSRVFALLLSLMVSALGIALALYLFMVQK